MNRWLMASIALLVALLALLWFEGFGRDGRRSGSPVVVETPQVVQAEEPAVLAAAPAAPTEPELVAPETSAVTREPAAGARAVEVARAVWVEGRVLFPEGTPLDEEAWVEARGRKFGDGSWQREKVASDGRFRVPFAEGSKTGWLALKARYSILARPLRWKKSDAAPIVLAPELGGRVAGRLRLPEDAQGSPGGRVSCSPVRAGSDVSFFLGGPPTAELGRGLEFAFDALPPRDVQLHYEGESFLAKILTSSVEPGVTSTVELELLRGADLAGRVLDANGAPLGGVQVRARSWLDGWSTERSVVSAANGSFQLRALAPPIELTGMLEGHVNARLELDELREGEVRGNLELIFGSGTTISGRVTWPDGRPARASVRIMPEEANVTGSRFDFLDGLVQTGEDGRFRLAGLGPGTHSVRASGAREGEKAPRPLWKAEARGVLGGTQGLELVLLEGLQLAGRVTDEHGATIEDARIVLRPSEMELWGDDIAFETTDRDGAFRVLGLRPGHWRAEVSCDGHVSADLEVEIPASAPLTVVLSRGARVNGLVLDEQGAPVPRAEVQATREQGHGAMGLAGARGAFELAGLAGGLVTLSASADGFAASEPMELELEAGETRGDVVLHLRRAGRITGEVLDRLGQPLGGVWVHAGDGTKGPKQSGADGRFELPGLLPGEVQVTATNAETGLLLSAPATVVAGETAHVRLQMPASSVHMHGRVWIAGEPTSGVTVRSQLREPKQDGPWCRSTEYGNYALELPGPGAYWIGVWDTEGGTHLWLAVDVPRGADFERDLELPLGRVSGRVRARDGTPLAGVRVEARQTSDKTSASGWGVATTDERGEYELVLPAATYELAAGGDGGDADPARSFARTAVAEIAVVNRSHLRGIDFELAEGGAIEGVVRWGDGSPGADAELWIGPQGKSVESSPLGRADARGRFRVEGLGRGKFVVTATLGQGTAEWQKIEIEPGSLRTLELRLAASESLEVRVLDRGTAVVAEVVAVDEKEKSYGSVSAPGLVARIGPLPAGRYRVYARVGERTGSAEITLTGKRETSTLEIVMP